MTFSLEEDVKEEEYMVPSEEQNYPDWTKIIASLHMTTFYNNVPCTERQQFCRYHTHILMDMTMRAL